MQMSNAAASNGRSPLVNINSHFQLGPELQRAHSGARPLEVCPPKTVFGLRVEARLCAPEHSLRRSSKADPKELIPMAKSGRVSFAAKRRGAQVVEIVSSGSL